MNDINWSETSRRQQKAKLNSLRQYFKIDER